MKDLNLKTPVRKIFQEMIGPRFKTNADGGVVTLTCDRFPNRIENKRYVIYILESLLAESRRIYAEYIINSKEEDSVRISTSTNGNENPSNS